jgi:hypothetical protein
MRKQPVIHPVSYKFTDVSELNLYQTTQHDIPEYGIKTYGRVEV